MGFSRQEDWSGLPCPYPEDLSDPEIELVSFMSPALAGGFFTTLGSTVEPTPSHMGSLCVISPLALIYAWLHCGTCIPSTEAHKRLPAQAAQSCKAVLTLLTLTPWGLQM